MRFTGMSGNIHIVVPADYPEERVDRFLTGYFKDCSRSKVQKWVEEGRVLMGSQILSKKSKIKGKDVLCVEVPAEKPLGLVGVKGVLDIVYEDTDIIVLNKPSGTVVHPGNGTGEDTLVHTLLEHCQGALSQLGGQLRPGVVHRLDKDTSGLIVFAKTDVAYLSLIKQFEARTVSKEYLALVRGIPNLQAGTIKAPIKRHSTIRVKMQVNPSGRFAHTDWQVEKSFKNKYCLLRCFLHTGRTHQIRVHLSHLGFPIVGDVSYGFRPYPQDLVYASRVMLHAQKLAFAHPRTGLLVSFHAPLAPDFSSLVATLES